MKLIPKKVFLVCGEGCHEDPLMSFELALRDAGIEKFNLVPVSSIIPPGCEFVERERGLLELKPGEIVFTVMARFTSNKQGKRIFASIAAAKPKDDSKIGYIAEHSGELEGEEALRHAEEIARLMVESTFSGEVALKQSIHKVAEVRNYTTVISAAVFVL
jgi:arginine decarboxylase